MDSHTSPKARRLAESAYTSPYSRAGAPSPHPNTDPYASLRASALATLEAMGYDPTTMVEHGVVWAEDQDPFAHVMHSRYIQIMGTSWHRVMESYDEFLSEEEYSNMIRAKTVIPVVKKYQLDIKRQVKYPDSVSLHVPARAVGIVYAHSSSAHFSVSARSNNAGAEPRHYVTLFHEATGHCSRMQGVYGLYQCPVWASC